MRVCIHLSAYRASVACRASPGSIAMVGPPWSGTDQLLAGEKIWHSICDSTY